MRRNIRLTGRKQLAKSSFGLSFSDNSGKLVAMFSTIDPDVLHGFPSESEIRVKLTENKLVEVLRFGTVAGPISSAELNEKSFRAPSCQVRVVGREVAANGKLLGSTDTWTLRDGGDSDGILLFQASNIAPRLWKLDIRDSGDEQPILYVDERIPDAALWAKSDPLFAACVLPHVVSEIMRKVLSLPGSPEEGWEFDWVTWAFTLMPGKKPPFGGPDEDKAKWLDDLISSFANRHGLADRVLAAMGGAQ
jgi:hypothetical protein